MPLEVIKNGCSGKVGNIGQIASVYDFPRSNVNLEEIKINVSFLDRIVYGKHTQKAFGKFCLGIRIKTRRWNTQFFTR